MTICPIIKKTPYQLSNSFLIMGSKILKLFNLVEKSTFNIFYGNRVSYLHTLKYNWYAQIRETKKNTSNTIRLHNDSKHFSDDIIHIHCTQKKHDKSTLVHIKYTAMHFSRTLDKIKNHVFLESLLF